MTWDGTKGLRELMASVISGVGVIECIEIAHPDRGTPWYFANWTSDVLATDHNAVPHTFLASDFALGWPKEGAQGALESSGRLRMAFNEEIYRFLRDLPLATQRGQPFVITAWLFLETDLTVPAFQPPWRWRSRRLRFSKTEMTFDLAARSFGAKNAGGTYYTIEEWPTLRSLEGER